MIALKITCDIRANCMDREVSRAEADSKVIQKGS